MDPTVEWKVSFASTASFAPPDPERPTVGQSGLNPLFDKGRSGTASRKTSKWPLASSLLDTRRQTELQPSRSDGEESPENAREVDPFRPSSSGAQGATHGARKGSAASTSTTSTTALTQQSWTDNIVHTFRRLSRSLTTLSSHSNLQTNSELQRAPSKLRTSGLVSITDDVFVAVNNLVEKYQTILVCEEWKASAKNYFKHTFTHMMRSFATLELLEVNIGSASECRHLNAVVGVKQQVSSDSRVSQPFSRGGGASPARCLWAQLSTSGLREIR
ncbi:hypothetical protein CYMTET_10047 [Cymbomonas tetramitiformis]|uniref:Uncharacterized protein n=1 Tax=Cymbomonas tetramitiformis TaxID=36881 RepID=A0AAE0GPX5_9CHLO|nr:hypothetical protein CYMTET_10047 [Cymbomonas tetramitiformis]